MAKSSTSGQGRPKGALNKATRPLRVLASQHSPEAIATLVGIMGDTTVPPAARVSAARELLDRAHGRPSQSMSMPVPAGTLAEQGQALIAAAVSGQLPLDHLNSVMAALTQQVRIIEQTELIQRLEVIESWLQKQNASSTTPNGC